MDTKLRHCLGYKVNGLKLITNSKLTMFILLKPSGHYTYRQFNIQQFCVLPTQLYL